MAWLAAANSDPAVFDSPEVLKLDRLPNPHLVFSSGIQPIRRFIHRQK